VKFAADVTSSTVFPLVPGGAGGGFASYTTANWAGYQVPKSDYGNHPIDIAYADWTVAKVPSDSHYKPSECHPIEAPMVAQWPGLGDSITHPSGDIIQAGTYSCAASTSNYGFWTEDFPKLPVFEGPSVRAGDEVFVSVYYRGNDETTYILENVSTATASEFTNRSPYVDESTAEFILEHPGSSPNPLPDFGTAHFSSCVFLNTKGSYTLSTKSNIVQMDVGHGDARTSGVSRGGFSVTWKART
jgi:hypothetical protein